MPDSPLIAAGAQVQPTGAAPLHSNEFFTGLWTNGNPLGPGAVPYLYQKFYSASRFERLIGGSNAEISTHLTPIRRPGLSVYNAGPFPGVNRLFEWRGFSSAGESIRIMASCDQVGVGGDPGYGTVRDVTGPSTNLVIANKAGNAGRTSFVAVGNNLYWGDGAGTGMLVQSILSWAANTQYNPGDFIIDSNGNVQLSVGAVTADINDIQIVDASVPLQPHRHQVTLYFDPENDLAGVPNLVDLNLAGLTTVPTLAGTTTGSIRIIEPTQIYFGQTPSVAPITAFSPETGTASTGSGITGATPPVWQTAATLVTQDGGQQWVNMGPATFPWGLPGPTKAPTVTLAPVPPLYDNWVASTWYAPYFYIYDSSAGLQKLITAGTLGPTQPTWGATVGAITNETSPGTAVWECVVPPGASAWAANTAYTSGQILSVAVTVIVNGASTTAVVLMQAQSAGSSGPAPPNWITGLNTLTTESTGLTWKNLGTVLAWAAMGAGAKLSLDTTVVDNNGYLEQIQNFGVTGTTEPTWANQSGITKDTAATNPALWLNAGPFAPAGAGGSWTYGYSGKSSITKAVSTMSPPSAAITVTVDNMVVVQGVGVANPPDDLLVIWRSLQGTTTPLYELDEIPNPGPGVPWTYYDRTPDQPSATSAGLNTFIQAPINGMNNPPPANFIPQCYYLSRIWGFSQNILMYSNGPDQGAVAGSPDQGFNALHQFTMQSLGVACWPTSMGLLVWTSSDVWAVLGQGTYDANGNPISPFYMVQFQTGIGLGNQDALTINGSTGYAMLTSHQVVSMDPGAGETEVGFPIGDIFDQAYDPSICYLAWHQGRSKDTALYVGDGANYWYRMAATAAPESGTVWSPRADIAAPGLVQALASVEISPGKKALLVGPRIDSNPILMRDLTVNSDNGVEYPVLVNIANVVLAQPGSVAGVQFVVTEEAMIAGAPPINVRLMFDEIVETGIGSAIFKTLRNITSDPPTLPPSQTVRVQRLWAAQDANTVVKCRHYQEQLIWPAGNFPNELFTHTVYGRLPEKARK